MLRITLSITVVISRDVSSGYRVEIVSYEYQVLDREEREILAFHWHPVGLSNVTDPHLHLSSRLNPLDMGRNQDPLDLAGMHMPTGFVALEDVVRLLITEFGIIPRRTDWDNVLRENRLAVQMDQNDKQRT